MEFSFVCMLSQKRYSLAICHSDSLVRMYVHWCIIYIFCFVLMSVVRNCGGGGGGADRNIGRQGD